MSLHINKVKQKRKIFLSHKGNQIMINLIFVLFGLYQVALHGIVVNYFNAMSSDTGFDYAPL